MCNTEPLSFREQSIIHTKKLRGNIDNIIQEVKELESCRETSLAITKLQESIMWLGMALKHYGETNPYLNSRDTTNTIVDPAADGLKF